MLNSTPSPTNNIPVITSCAFSAVQAPNPPNPSFRLEMSDIDGSLIHRCECGKAIKRAADLKRHWNSRSHGGRGYDCAKCKRSYSRKYMLDRHTCRASIATTGNEMDLDL